jgi:hypothetical protein
MRKHLLIIITIIALTGITVAIKADPGDPGGEPGAPLDGGLLTVLIGSGIAYLGMKRKNKLKKGNDI